MTIKVNFNEKDFSDLVLKRELGQPTLAYELNVKADALRLANLHREAVAKYLHSILLDRTNIDAYIGLAKCYKFLGKIDKAINSLESAKNLTNDSFEIFYELGVCYISSGDVCSAMPNLMCAIKLNPNNVNAQIQLAHAHEFCEEEDMALMIYQKIIESNPGSIQAYECKANLLMSQSLYREASKILNDVLKINPNYYRAYMGIAICFDKLHRFSDAIRYYKKFLAIKPNSKYSKDINQRLSELARIKQAIDNKSSSISLSVVS